MEYLQTHPELYNHISEVLPQIRYYLLNGDYNMVKVLLLQINPIVADICANSSESQYQENFSKFLEWLSEAVSASYIAVDGGIMHSNVREYMELMDLLISA